MDCDKFITFKFEKADHEKRTIVGLATTFGNIDLDGDIIESTAFDEQLEEAGGRLRVKGLWQHQTFSPIGMVDLTKVDAGLRAEFELTKNIQQADEALAAVGHGSIDAFSIGMRVLREAFDQDRGANIMTILKLREVSLVTFEANPQAKISDIKSEKDKAALKRRLERCLRDVGNISKSFAESIIADGFNGLGDLVKRKSSEERQLLIQHLKNLEHT